MKLAFSVVTLAASLAIWAPFAACIPVMEFTSLDDFGTILTDGLNNNFGLKKWAPGGSGGYRSESQRSEYVDPINDGSKSDDDDDRTLKG